MPELESRKLLDAMLNSVPDLAAVFILMDDEGHMEVGTQGFGQSEEDQDKAIMMLCFHLATEIAQKLQQRYPADFPTTLRNGKNKPVIHLPPGWQNGLRNN